MSDEPSHRDSEHRAPARPVFRIYHGAMAVFMIVILSNDVREHVQKGDIARAIAYGLLGAVVAVYFARAAIAGPEWVEAQRAALRQPVSPWRAVGMVVLGLGTAIGFSYIPDQAQGLVLLLVIVGSLSVAGLLHLRRTGVEQQRG